MDDMVKIERCFTKTRVQLRTHDQAGNGGASNGPIVTGSPCHVPHESLHLSGGDVFLVPCLKGDAVQVGRHRHASVSGADFHQHRRDAKPL